MPKAEYRATLAQDRNTVLIEVMIDDQPQAWSSSTAAELSSLIDLLVSLRAGMAAPFPTQPDVNAAMPVVVDPCWQAGMTERGEFALRLRHPGLGWTEYQLPAASAGPLTDVLERARGAA